MNGACEWCGKSPPEVELAPGGDESGDPCCKGCLALPGPSEEAPLSLLEALAIHAPEAEA